MKHYLSRKVKIVLILAVLLAVGLAALSNLTSLSLPELFVKGKTKNLHHS